MVKSNRERSIRVRTSLPKMDNNRNWHSHMKPSKDIVMSSTADKLTAYARDNKLVAGVVILGIIALIAIGGVMAWNNTSATDMNNDTQAASENRDNESADEVAKPGDQKPAGESTEDSGQSTGAGSYSPHTIHTDASIRVTHAAPTAVSVAPAVNTDQTPEPGRGSETPVTPPTSPVTPPTAPISANLFVNPTIEEGTATTATGWSNTFNPNDMVAQFSRADGHDSQNSLKIEVTNPGSLLSDTEYRYAQWAPTDTIAVTAGNTYDYSHYFQSDVSAQVDVEFTHADGSFSYGVLGNTPSVTDWTQFNASITIPAGVTGIRIYHAISQVGYLQTDDYSLTAAATPTTPTTPTNPTTPTTPSTGFSGGRVSLTFDDGLLSVYRNALPLLHQFGFKSTHYLISNTLTNNEDYTEYFNVAQAREFYSPVTGVAGTELANHTAHHCSLTSTASTDDPINCLTNLNPEAQRAQNLAELTTAKNDLRTLFPEFAFDSLASPYGNYDAAAIADMQASGITANRSVESGFNSFGSVNQYGIVVQNIENTTTTDQVKAWIDQAINTNSWLVLVYHDVTGPNETPGAYGTTSANLNAHFEYLQARQVPVVTVAEALAENNAR